MMHAISNEELVGLREISQRRRQGMTATRAWIRRKRLHPVHGTLTGMGRGKRWLLSAVIKALAADHRRANS